MNDRELLELAAKAAGISGNYIDVDTNNGRVFGLVQSVGIWNPLTDDGDALRLAVKLNMSVTTNWTDINYSTGEVVPVNESEAETGLPGKKNFVCHEYHEGNPYAATRRAIVRAAAEIGKDMK